MEAKLKEYRTLKRRKELIDKTKEKLEKTKDKVLDFLTPKMFKDMEKRQEEEVLLLEDEEHEEIMRNPTMEETVEEIEEEPEIEEIPVSWRYVITKWTIILIIWLALYAYFLKVQFGAVFFGISLLVFICVNTRTRPKKRGEVSAYSVFNKGCRSIDGTTKAEDLQKQMLYGGRLF
ncbi:SAYSvFN domain-containing protein 1 isoform X2 [Aricia agestis]|nr:SAYSvFN domain-containing protein 1 isoform X2 [Aricia agestis]XP_041969942.1 SAYSvFN domain-containing protein 1 isoform X2 [Aricia agestis]